MPRTGEREYIWLLASWVAVDALPSTWLEIQPQQEENLQALVHWHLWYLLTKTHVHGLFHIPGRHISSLELTADDGVQTPGKWSESESHSVMSHSLQPHELYSPWNSPGQNTGVGSLSLLQGIFPTQRSNPGLLHYKQILYQLLQIRVLFFPQSISLRACQRFIHQITQVTEVNSPGKKKKSVISANEIIEQSWRKKGERTREKETIHKLWVCFYRYKDSWEQCHPIEI